MKNLNSNNRSLLAVAILLPMLFALTACNQKSDNQPEGAMQAMPQSMDSMQPAVQDPMDQEHMVSEPMGSSLSSVTVAQSRAASTVIDHYLQMKDALVEDNSPEAASAGRLLAEAFAGLDKSALSESQQREFDEIIETATLHAEHILANSGNIVHQREHFVSLSTDVHDLLIVVGTDRTLYQVHCSMYNNNRGGSWLSASQAIENPYYGAQMLTCGVPQSTISAG